MPRQLRKRPAKPPGPVKFPEWDDEYFIGATTDPKIDDPLLFPDSEPYVYKKMPPKYKEKHKQAYYKKKFAGMSVLEILQQPLPDERAAHFIEYDDEHPERKPDQREHHMGLQLNMAYLLSAEGARKHDPDFYPVGVEPISTWKAMDEGLYSFAEKKKLPPTRADVVQYRELSYQSTKVAKKFGEEWTNYGRLTAKEKAAKLKAKNKAENARRTAGDVEEKNQYEADTQTAAAKAVEGNSHPLATAGAEAAILAPDRSLSGTQESSSPAEGNIEQDQTVVQEAERTTRSSRTRKLTSKAADEAALPSPPKKQKRIHAITEQSPSSAGGNDEHSQAVAQAEKTTRSGRKRGLTSELADVADSPSPHKKQKRIHANTKDNKFQGERDDFVSPPSSGSSSAGNHAGQPVSTGSNDAQGLEAPDRLSQANMSSRDAGNEGTQREVLTTPEMSSSDKEQCPIPSIEDGEPEEAVGGSLPASSPGGSSDSGKIRQSDTGDIANEDELVGSFPRVETTNNESSQRSSPDTNVNDTHRSDVDDHIQPEADDLFPYKTLIDIWQEETFHTRPAVRIHTPDSIKAILVDDWENVTKNGNLIKIPHQWTVNKVLDEYHEEEKPKRRAGSAEADILEEVISGLKEYFHLCLGRILLYKYERQQYLEARKLYVNNDSPEWENKGPGDVYGAEHLARLIVSMPELIAQTNMDHQAISRLREEMTKLTAWLGKNSKKYFVGEYEPPSMDYVEKARGIGN